MYTLLVIDIVNKKENTPKVITFLLPYSKKKTIAKYTQLPGSDRPSRQLPSKQQTSSRPSPTSPAAALHCPSTLKSKYKLKTRTLALPPPYLLLMKHVPSSHPRPLKKQTFPHLFAFRPQSCNFAPSNPLQDKLKNQIHHEHHRQISQVCQFRHDI